jgi:hypothetical protein
MLLNWKASNRKVGHSLQNTRSGGGFLMKDVTHISNYTASSLGFFFESLW